MGRTLPELPGCGRAASVRIEAYSPRDGGAHGSLDGSAYACDEHTAAVATAISAAGFTAHRTPVAELHQLGTEPTRCGDGFDYIAGEPLTAPAPPAAGPRAELVREAVDALRGFGITDRHGAVRVLDLWARRAELSGDAVAHVLEAFPKHPRWCDRQECSTTSATGGRQHASTPIQVGAGMVAQLTQYRDTAPTVEVLSWHEQQDQESPAPDPTNPDDVLILTLDETRALAGALQSLHDRGRVG